MLGKTGNQKMIHICLPGDYAQVKTTHGNIENDVVDQAMKTLGVDAVGLDDLDRRLLGVIARQYKGGPVGIDALAATLNEEVDTLVDVIEPYLLKIGFLKRTSRGRELSQTAVKHINGEILCPDALQQDFLQ